MHNYVMAHSYDIYLIAPKTERERQQVEEYGGKWKSKKHIQ